jgi:CDP-6-deoxy-D-xylo-4-hexulose-3-dehydrase
MGECKPESDWRRVVAAEWTRRAAERETGPVAASSAAALFPLAANPFGEEEILAMTEVLLSGRLTMGENVERAEKEFAAAVGAPYAVMVNSGSSANLLMVSALLDRSRGSSASCTAGDEVLVPAVCWSTTVAPLLQLGLVPIFVDVDPNTFNISLHALEAACEAHPRARALIAVHVLGNSAEINKLLDIVRRHNLILLEDTCESLGSFAVVGTSPPAMLGTFGSFGSYSFFFSHHVTSGEGGMVVCHTEEDLNCLRRLRAHGWTRHLTNRAEVEAHYPDIDPRFLFLVPGYNVRPMEVQGAMLRVQIAKLEAFNRCRRDNLARIEAALSRDARFASHMTLMKPSEGTDPAWFGICVVLLRPFAHQLREYLEHLSNAGIENRPIISGNFVRQPMIAQALPHLQPSDFPGAEVLHTRGFFIGVHQFPVSETQIEGLVRAMLDFEFIPRRVVLVTGSQGMLGRHVCAEVERLAAGKVSARSTSDRMFPLTNGSGVLPNGELATEASHTEFGDGVQTEWIFASRKDADLNDLAAVERLFKRFQPTHVLHLAAHLQSLNEMTARPVDFWLGNVTVNNNVLSTAHKFQSWCGPIRVISVLSTVMFPRDATFPVDAAQAESGTLHPAGEAYALAKRSLAALSRWYNQQYGDNFLTILPGNFFGAHGDWSPATAPLVNALITKAVTAAMNGTPTISVMGTGRPLRQLMHARDLARILLWALDHFTPPPSSRSAPLVVAGPEHSIREIAEMVCEAVGFQGSLAFDTQAVDGPLRRTADTSVFESLCPRFAFTPLPESIRLAVDWYRQHMSTTK